MAEQINVAVIGAGVVGLSNALNIKSKNPHLNVTIFADKLNENTLSSGAGGLFRPEINVHSDTKRVEKWYRKSASHFFDIANSAERHNAGIRIVSGYQLSSNKAFLKNKLLKKLVPMYRKLTENELKIFPSHFKDGICYFTFIVDCRYYLPWMKMKFEQAGGKVIMKHISSFDEIPPEFDIIVNCTGLASKYLMKDNMLVPIRGQTIRVKAPWIKHFYYGDDVYVIPGLDYVTLGGIKDYGSWNLNINSYQKKYIWDKCLELVPSLKNAEIVKDWVGLRPYRSEVRVDSIMISSNGTKRKIINNYGHGSHGVSLSWGTAQEATILVERLLANRNLYLSKL